MGRIIKILVWVALYSNFGLGRFIQILVWVALFKFWYGSLYSNFGLGRFIQILVWVALFKFWYVSLYSNCLKVFENVIDSETDEGRGGVIFVFPLFFQRK